MPEDYGDNENNTLYLTFKDTHPCWLFVGYGIVKTGYLVPGVLLNLSLIIVTLRSNSLRGTANYLLALNSLFELFHQPGHLLSITMAFSGANFLDYPTAVRIATPALFGLIGVGPSLFFTGLDRLFAVTFLSFYQRINMAVYLLLISICCSLYSGYGVYLVHKNTWLAKWDNYQVPGNVGDLFQGEASEYYYVYTMILNGVTIGIYVVVGFIIRCRSADQSHRRLFRSLVVIISFGLGGYFLMRIYTSLIVPNVRWDQTTVWTVRQAFAIPLNLSAGSNAPILYLTSVEYRKAYQKEWANLLNGLRRLGLLKEDEHKNQSGKSRAHVLTNTLMVVRPSMSSVPRREPAEHPMPFHGTTLGPAHDEF